MAGSVLTLVLMIVTINRSISQPFNGFMRTVKTAGADLKSLSDAMSKLAQEISRDSCLSSLSRCLICSLPI